MAEQFTTYVRLAICSFISELRVKMHQHLKGRGQERPLGFLAIFESV